MKLALQDQCRPSPGYGALGASHHRPSAAASPLFILGSPRSGTSWIAKILDSHPDVLYRHEPDIDIPPHGVPHLCGEAEIARHEDAARDFIGQWVAARTVRTAGGLPAFRKRSQKWFGPALRRACILGLRGLEEVPGLAALARRMPVPDLVGSPAPQDLRIVIKSINALGRAGLLAAAAPQASFVQVLRHPCAHVASMLRGHRAGKFARYETPGADVQAALERLYGLSPGRYLALPEPARIALLWALHNDIALEQLRGHPRAKVLRYEDVCADPFGEARALLGFVGLGWDAQTERFVRASTTHDGPARYYSVFRNTEEAAGRWRRELDAPTQRGILDAIDRSRAGRLAIAPARAEARSAPALLPA